ncbi:hypothetical protein [Caballeronia sp. S22]|uniref:hypothetical protein n=1 Tax=Caballeronia sp. S22 TaxID=3137182 RepID=UPI003531143E
MGLSGVYPPLYGGNMILYGAQLRTVQVKLQGVNGTWRFTRPIALKGGFKRLQPLAGKMDMSPTLVLRGARARLVCPVKLEPEPYVTNKAFGAQGGRVCAIDVGINTAATAAIVDTSGTVIARKFFTCGRHNDQRDRLTADIAAKQAATGQIGRRQPHSSALHRRIANISKQVARTLSSELLEFAGTHGARLFIIEDLKG